MLSSSSWSRPLIFDVFVKYSFDRIRSLVFGASKLWSKSLLKLCVPIYCKRALVLDFGISKLFLFPIDVQSDGDTFAIVTEFFITLFLLSFLIALLASSLISILSAYYLMSLRLSADLSINVYKGAPCIIWLRSTVYSSSAVTKMPLFYLEA